MVPLLFGRATQSVLEIGMVDLTHRWNGRRVGSNM